MNVFGLENIAAQGPAFFHDLTKVISDIVASLPKPTPDETLSERLQNVTFLLTDSERSDELKKVIRKYLGFEPNYVKFDPSIAVAAMMIAQVQIPRVVNTPYGSFSEFQKILSNVSKNLDRDTGAYSSIDAKEIHTTLFLTSSLFILHEYYPEAHFTPEMISAIILHELGHTYDYIERCFTCRRVVSLCDQLSYFKPRDISVSDVSIMVKEGLALFKNLPTRNKTNKLYQSQLHDVLKTLSDTPNISEQSLIALVNYISLLYSTVFSTDFALRMFGDLSYASDVMVTKEVSSWEERTADAFAARYGAGPSLIKALQLLNTTANVLGKKLDGDLYPATRTAVNLKYKLTPFQILHVITESVPTETSGAYDQELKRYREIIKSLYPVFKNPKLSKSLSAFYIEQIQSCEDNIDDYLSRPEIKYRETFQKGLEILNKYGFAAFHLFSEDLTQQYDKLQQLTRDFVDNPLFYQQARLDQLINH